MTKDIQELRAKYNAKGNAIIPNTFQHPNIFVDRLMYYLTPVENTILTFAVRRILGFQTNIMSRRDNISLSQFTDGITAEDGRPLSMGCGISAPTVIVALEALAKYRILLPTTEKPDPKRGQEYWLQDNEHAIDWDGLELRRGERADKNLRRTAKARDKARYSVGLRCSVGLNPSPQSDLPLGVSGTDTQNPRKPTETHFNGANAPLDWKLGHDQEITAKDLDVHSAERYDAANLIATGMGMNSVLAFDLAMAFMETRNILLPAKKAKGQRRVVREMIEMKVRPEHITEAVKKLLEANMTVTDLFSVAKTAESIANPAPEASGYNPQGLTVGL